MVALPKMKRSNHQMLMLAGLDNFMKISMVLCSRSRCFDDILIIRGFESRSAEGAPWRHYWRLSRISFSASVASRHSDPTLARASQQEKRRWSSTELVRGCPVFWTGTAMWWPVRWTCCRSTDALLPRNRICLTRSRAGAARAALKTAAAVGKINYYETLLIFK